MALATYKRGDRLPALVVTLQQTIGSATTPINLSTASSVKFLMKSGATLKQGTCVITDAPNGIVTYNWGATDLDTAGDYQAEWEITWTGGSVQTVPSGPTDAAPANPDYFTIKVLEDLG